MTRAIPPGGPHQSRVYVERVAYRKLIQGQITAEQYCSAIAPPASRRLLANLVGRLRGRLRS